MLVLDVPLTEELLIGDTRISFCEKNGQSVRIAVEAMIDVPLDEELLIGDTRLKFKDKTGQFVRIAIGARPDQKVTRVHPGTNDPVPRRGAPLIGA